MSTTWNTKYGPRKVRHDPPTLEEAIFAARGLTDDLQQQAEIAAGLMELPLETVQAAKVAVLSRNMGVFASWCDLPFARFTTLSMKGAASLRLDRID